MIAITASAALLSGCANDNTEPREPISGELAGHVHGLAIVKNDLLIATHTGLWHSEAGSETVERIGTSRRDVMGFTALPDRLIGSGHPDPSDAGGEPANVGVIESRDSGRTWTQVALAGEVDFHTLAASEASVYGYDAPSGRLMASMDAGRTWARRTAPREVIALAARPGASREVLAATTAGIQLSLDAGRSWRPSDDTVGLVAYGRDAAWSVDGQGVVRRSDVPVSQWTNVGRVTGAPVAIVATADGVVVALDDGTIVESADGGASFATRTRL